MQKVKENRISAHYYIVFCMCILFIILAFTFDTPAQILNNYYQINISRSVLVTDYIAVGGIGATLINSALSGIFFLFLLIIYKREPDGAIIASLWTTMGFSFFGKNLFNMLPLLLGIMLYSKVKKVKFSDLFVQAMLCATIAPLVSEIAFLNKDFSLLRIVISYGVGIFVGFIFPVVAQAMKRMHRGYCLYNSGITGGFIATFSVGLLKCFGIDILSVNMWSTKHTAFLATLAFSIAIMLIAYGLITEGPANALKKLLQMQKEKSQDEDDYLSKYGNACYINIGAMCIVITGTMLLLKVPINGPVLGGIFTVSGFSASSKNLRNAVPILLGSIIATQINHLEQTHPANILAILFSTGLAPIAGKYGWLWGVAVGFLHVTVAVFIGQLNGGLNLYNNGFAGGFVAMTIVPLIVFSKDIFSRQSKGRI